MYLIIAGSNANVVYDFCCTYIRVCAHVYCTLTICFTSECEKLCTVFNIRDKDASGNTNNEMQNPYQRFDKFCFDAGIGTVVK